MKVKVNNYTFDKTAKTVTLIDYTTVMLDGLLLITNVTDNIIIYNFANPALGGTVLGNVITLDYNTVSMDNLDSLQIFYDDGENTTANILETLAGKLERDDYFLVLNTIKDAVTNPLWYNDAINGLTIGGTVAVSSGTITTVATLTNQTSIGGFSADMMVENNMDAAWALTIRAKLI